MGRSIYLTDGDIELIDLMIDTLEGKGDICGYAANAYQVDCIHDDKCNDKVCPVDIQVARLKKKLRK